MRVQKKQRLAGRPGRRSLHGSRALRKDRGGCHHLRYLLLPREARRFVPRFRQNPADHHFRNTRHHRHYLSRLQKKGSR